MRASLADFEANFLRLIDKITNGSRIEINQTGNYFMFSAIGMNGAPVFWSWWHIWNFREDNRLKALFY